VSAHFMRVEWSGGGRFPSYSVICNEPPEARCRAQFPCDCEEYAALGFDGARPWHELTDGYLTDDQREQDPPPRHYGEPGGECNYALWLDNGDCADELGHGTADIPVTFEWDGDGYEWHVVNGGAS